MFQRSALAASLIMLASTTLFPVPVATQQQQQLQQLQPAAWGAPPIEVTHDGKTWTIAGQTQRVTLNESDLSTTIQAADGTTWKMVPSGTQDLLVRTNGNETWLRLTDAANLDIVPYRTGYSVGVKMTVSGFKPAPDIRLVLTMALEG